MKRPANDNLDLSEYQKPLPRGDYWIFPAFVVFVIAVLLSCVWRASASEPIVGRASVIDGDTIEIRGQRIRLWGIDAPEGRQRCFRAGKPWRCGTVAANALDGYIAARNVTCAERDRDRYRRIVALCTVAVSGQDIGAWLVRNGLALDYERYSGGAYAAGQAAAERDRAGIWQGEFVPPWEWRRQQ